MTYISSEVAGWALLILGQVSLAQDISCSANSWTKSVRC